MIEYPIKKPIPRVVLRLVDQFLSLILRNKQGPKTNVRRILVCHLAHLGDLVLASALIPPLQKEFPNAEIGFCIANIGIPLLQGHPSIRWIHTLDHWKHGSKRGYWKNRKQVLQELRIVQYDLAIDLPVHFPNCAPLLWQAKIPERIGWESAGLSAFLTQPTSWPNLERSIALDFLELAQLPWQKLSPCLPPLGEGGKHTTPYLLFHPGARRTEKKWKGFLQLASMQTLPILITGKGEQEWRQADEIAKQVPHVTNLVNELSLQELRLKIQRAKAIVCLDSLAGHLAADSKTPGIVLFNKGVPIKRWAPLSKNLHCLLEPTALQVHEALAAICADESKSPLFAEDPHDLPLHEGAHFP